jgi:hypothetical protein
VKLNETAAFDVINILSRVPWSSSVTSEYHNEVIFGRSVSILGAAEMEKVVTYFLMPLTQLCAHTHSCRAGRMSYLHSVCA